MNISFIVNIFGKNTQIFDSRKFWIFIIGIPLMLVANIKIEKPLKHQRRLGLDSHLCVIDSFNFPKGGSIVRSVNM